MTNSNRLPREVLYLALFLVAGCAPADRGSAREEPAIHVSVVRAGEGKDLTLVLPARITAQEEVTLTARLSARLTRLEAQEGTSFRAGQTLAVFDAPETRGALDAARAGAAAANLALDLARKQEARMDSLYTLHVAALRELEGAQADREAAEAAAAQARAQLEQVESGVRLTAPFDGVVVRRRVDAGATVGAGQPVLDLRSRHAGEIAASVPESELARLSRGGCEYQTGDGAWMPAILVRVDGMTDYATRSRVARFRPLDRARLDAGAFARVRLSAPVSDTPHAHPASLDLPASALIRRGGLTGAYVIEDGVARLRWLRTGREGLDRVEVLAGLEESDPVIANPSGLEDGRRVIVAP